MCVCVSRHLIYLITIADSITLPSQPAALTPGLEGSFSNTLIFSGRHIPPFLCLGTQDNTAALHLGAAVNGKIIHKKHTHTHKKTPSPQEASKRTPMYSPGAETRRWAFAAIHLGWEHVCGTHSSFPPHCRRPENDRTAPQVLLGGYRPVLASRRAPQMESTNAGRQLPT